MQNMPDAPTPRDPSAPPPFDPAKVLANGHAIGLISTLVEGIQQQIAGAEERLRTEIREVEARLSEKQTQTGRDVAAAVAWQRAYDEVEREKAIEIRVATARREGRTEVFIKVGAWIERNPKAASMLGTLVAGGGVALVTRLLS